MSDLSTRYDQYSEFAPLFGALADAAPGSTRRATIRDELIAGHLAVAQHIALRFTDRGEPLEDLEQVAVVGLISAVDRFDPARGIDFLTFAVPTITGELKRHFRDRGWATHVPRRLKDLSVAIGRAMSDLPQQLGRAPTARELADHLEQPLDDVLEALAARSCYRTGHLDPADGEQLAAGFVDHEIDRIDIEQSLRPMLANLPARERDILILRFFHNMTQSQIGRRLGISQMHVSRLLARSLTQLRQQLDEGTAAQRGSRAV